MKIISLFHAFYSFYIILFCNYVVKSHLSSSYIVVALEYIDSNVPHIYFFAIH